ncbi:MAG TPA: RNA polymerase sigma-70 factor [Gemmatimonadaceae bacterium]|nr:RNA polymerase sigma-70 factor [Gemmatimonadaceae bacterium]
MGAYTIRPTMDDRPLLQKLRSGDEGAYDAVFREWYPALVRLAVSLVRDHDAGEEVAQDVMHELWRRRESLEEDMSVRAYLLRSVRNRSLNHLRHRRVRRESEHDVEALYNEPVASDQPVVAQELSEAVQQAFDELPPRCREVFALSRLHGLTYAEIATALAISQKTVEAQVGKALRVMRQRLAAWLPDR